MTFQSKATIKTYFETGDKPTQGQFENLIDSYQDYSDLLTKIDQIASAGNNGFLNIQSNASANVYPAGSLGLALLQTDTAASAQAELGLSSGTTGFVKVTDNDTTDGRLFTKVSAGTGLQKVVINSAANEQMVMSLSYVTTAEAAAGAIATGAMNPVLTKAAIEGQFATTAAANAGTDATGVMNPVTTKNAIQTIAFTSANYVTTAQAVEGTMAGGVMNPVLVRNVVDGAAGGDLVLLAAVSAAGATSIDITSVITSAYSVYKIFLDNVRPSTDDTAISLRTSTNNGSSFDSGATNYVWAHRGWSVLSSAAPSNVFDTSDAQITLTGHTGAGGTQVGSATSEGLSMEVTLHHPMGGTQYKRITYNGAYNDTAGNLVWVNGCGSRDATTDVDAVRILAASGNINGNVYVYGAKNV